MNASEVATPEITEGIGEIARAGVLIPCREDISGYLLRYPDTTGWLVALARAAREQLPADVQLNLELYRDPEVDDRYLTLYMRQQEYLRGLLDRAEAIMSQFPHELETCSGWILLTTDILSQR